MNELGELGNDPAILKYLVRDLLSQMALRPETNRLRTLLAKACEQPVINLPEEFDRFEAQLGQSADALDQWSQLQMELLSDMGEGRWKILVAFCDLHNRVQLASVAAAQHQTISSAPTDASFDLSYVSLLIIRTYGPSLILVDATKA